MSIEKISEGQTDTEVIRAFFQSRPKFSSLSLNKGGRGKSNTCIPFRVFISACPMTSLTASLMKTNVFRVRRKSAID